MKVEGLHHPVRIFAASRDGATFVNALRMIASESRAA